MSEVGGRRSEKRKRKRKRKKMSEVGMQREL
jgi:hypothetical protein